MTTANIEHFDSDELLALARLSLERNDVEGALLKLKKIIDAGDPPADAIGLGARVYAQLGLYDRAGKLYERFLQAHPKAFLEQFQLGMTRFDAGRPDEAIKIWDEVLKDRPDYPPAVFYKALALAQSERAADAKLLLERLLKSVSVDNLYFGRSKELLQAIESGASVQKSTGKGQNGGTKSPVRGAPADPYRTEH